MGEDPQKGRRIVLTLNPRDASWLFPGEISGIRALLGWTIDCRVVDGGIPPLVAEILSRALCRQAMLTFYWEPERKPSLPERWKSLGKPSDRWKPLGQDWVKHVKPRLPQDVLLREPTFPLLMTNQPERARELFDNSGWSLEGQRVFLTPTNVFPAFEYRQVNAVFKWSPHPHWWSNCLHWKGISLHIDVAEQLAGTNVSGLLLPLVDGGCAELIIFDEAQWPMFHQALARECATAGVEFQLVDEPTFHQTEWYVLGGFWVGEDPWVKTRKKGVVSF